MEKIIREKRLKYLYIIITNFQPKRCIGDEHNVGRFSQRDGVEAVDPCGIVVWIVGGGYESLWSGEVSCRLATWNSSLYEGEL